MKKVMLLGVNESTHTIKRLLKELRDSHIKFDFLKWGDLTFDPPHLIIGGRKINFNSYSSAVLDTPSYDFFIRDKKKAKKFVATFDLTKELHLLTRLLLSKRIFVLNGQIIVQYPSYDKFDQSFLFSQKNIPAFPTAHLSDNDYKKVKNFLRAQNFSFPIVVKRSDGGMGEDIYKIDNAHSLKTLLENKRNQNLIFQPYFKNDGDYRVLVCHGKALGIMKRQASRGEWRNNFALGGSISRHIEPRMSVFSENVCRKIGFDLAGVDVMKINNRYKVIEINLFPRFEGFERVHPEINVAREIVKLLKKK